MAKAPWVVLATFLAVSAGCSREQPLIETIGPGWEPIGDLLPPIPVFRQGVALYPGGDGELRLALFQSQSVKTLAIGPGVAGDWRALAPVREVEKESAHICASQSSTGMVSLLYGRPLHYSGARDEDRGRALSLFETARIGEWLDCASGVSGTHVLYQEGGGGVDDGILWYGIIAEGGEWTLHPVKIAEAAGNGLSVRPTKEDGALLAYTTPHSNWQEDETTPRLGSLVLAAVGGGEASPPEVILESVGLDALPALGRHQVGALTLAYFDDVGDSIQVLERSGPGKPWQQTELAQVGEWPAAPVLVDMGDGTFAILFAAMTKPVGDDYARAAVDLHICTKEDGPRWECLILFSGTFAIDRYLAAPWLSATRHDGRLYAVFVNPNGDAVQVIVVEGDGEVGTYVVEPPH